MSEIPNLPLCAPCYPFHRDGPLPPGLTATTIRLVFENLGWPPHKLLKALGVRPGVGSPDQLLRRLLDKPQFRSQLKEVRRPGDKEGLEFAEALFLYVRAGKGVSVLESLVHTVVGGRAGRSSEDIIAWQHNALPSLLQQAAELDGRAAPSSIAGFEALEQVDRHRSRGISLMVGQDIMEPIALEGLPLHAGRDTINPLRVGGLPLPPSGRDIRLQTPGQSIPPFGPDARLQVTDQPVGGPGYAAAEPETVVPGSVEEAVVLLFIYYATLTSPEEDATILLQPLLKAGIRFQRYFGATPMEVPAWMTAEEVETPTPAPTLKKPSSGRHSKAMRDYQATVATERAHRQELGGALILDRRSFDRAAAREQEALEKLNELEKNLRERAASALAKLEPSLQTCRIQATLVPPEEGGESLAAWADDLEAASREAQLHFRAITPLLERLARDCFRYEETQLLTLECTTVDGLVASLGKRRRELEKAVEALQFWVTRAADLKSALRDCVQAGTSDMLTRATDAAGAMLIWMTDRNAQTLELRPLVYRHYSEVADWEHGCRPEALVWLHLHLNEMSVFDGLDAVRTTLLFLRPPVLRSLLNCDVESINRYVVFATFAETVARRHPLFFRDIWPYAAWEDPSARVGEPLATLFKVCHQLFVMYERIDPILDLLRAPTRSSEDAIPGPDLETVIALLESPPTLPRKTAPLLEAAASTWFRPLIPAIRERRLDDVESAVLDLKRKHAARALDRDLYGKSSAGARLRKQQAPQVCRYLESVFDALSAWVARERALDARSAHVHDEPLQQELLDAVRSLEKVETEEQRTTDAGGVRWLELEVGVLLDALRSGAFPAASLALCGELPTAESLFVPPDADPAAFERLVSWTRWTRGVRSREWMRAPLTDGDLDGAKWGWANRALESLPCGHLVRWPEWNRGKDQERHFYEPCPDEPQVTWPTWLTPTPDSMRMFASWIGGRTTYLDLLQDALARILYRHESPPGNVIQAFMDADHKKAFGEAILFPGFFSAPPPAEAAAHRERLDKMDENGRKELDELLTRCERLLEVVKDGELRHNLEAVADVFPAAVLSFCVHKESAFYQAMGTVKVTLDAIEERITETEDQAQNEGPRAECQDP